MLKPLQTVRAVEIMPEFSVIIPTHNRGRIVCEAVDSVLAQTFTDFEIVVIDDGSTDDTRELLAGYAGRIRYVRQDRHGRSAARNLGIMLARGRYCAFLDSDDTWFPDKLERQIARLGDSPEVGLLHGPVEVVDAEGDPLDDVTDDFRAGLARQQAKGETYEELLLHHTMYTSTTVVPRSVFDAVGMFDPALDPREDLDLYLRIALGFRITSLAGAPLCRYRTRRDELVNPPDLSQVYIRVHRKHLEILRTKLAIPAERRPRALRNVYVALARDYHAAKNDPAARSYLTKALAADPLGVLAEPAFSHLAVRALAPPFLLDWLKGLRDRIRIQPC
jgi:glycosyltransferase involved in cell wall biosynthesis